MTVLLVWLVLLLRWSRLLLRLEPPIVIRLVYWRRDIARTVMATSIAAVVMIRVCSMLE